MAHSQTCFIDRRHTETTKTWKAIRRRGISVLRLHDKPAWRFSGQIFNHAPITSTTSDALRRPDQQISLRPIPSSTLPLLVPNQRPPTAAPPPIALATARDKSTSLPPSLLNHALPFRDIDAGPPRMPHWEESPSPRIPCSDREACTLPQGRLPQGGHNESQEAQLGAAEDGTHTTLLGKNDNRLHPRGRTQHTEPLRCTRPRRAVSGLSRGGVSFG